MPFGSTISYQINEKRFFFGKWFTVIFLRSPLGTPLRGRNMFTWRPTLIFLVSAPWGKTAWTWGTTVLFTTPPKKNKIENFNLFARANIISNSELLFWTFQSKNDQNDQKRSKWSKWSKLPKKFKLVKMTKNGQNYQNDQNDQKSSKLIKMIRMVKNDQK